jgi:D-alanyl-D-alanine carboxypeptidase/D-alanyl-D-alanine-endopeptidase (penicillin-binding protein 4)
MKRRKSLVGGGVALAAVLLAGLPASTVSALPNAQLTADLDALVHDPSLRNATVGLVVRNADTGDLLYSAQSDRREQPASNMKLATSTVALDVLGPNRRFTTSVSSTGQTDGQTLTGDLYLRGTGDPTMLNADYDDLAAKVAATGVREVQGKLVADDTWFDAERLGFGWAWDDEPYSYSAQTSALTVSPDTDYDAGTVVIRTAPATAGAPAVVTTDPPTSYLQIQSSVVTGAAGSASTVSVARDHGTNVIRVTGSIPAGGSVNKKWTSVAEPTGLVASLFRDALARHGVQVTGPTQTSVATPAGAQQLASHDSMPLSQLLTPFLKLSNNMHAEILVKTMGRVVSGAGTWAAGRSVISQRLTTMGVASGTTYVADGSGLSRMDQLAPDQVISILRAARTKPWFPTWYTALPIAGMSDPMVGGTLRSRMQGTPAAGNLHAKTGSMTGVSALSGYITSADGQPLVFSLISNNFLGSAKAVEDAVAVRLAKYRADETVRAATPGRAPVELSGNTRDDVECAWIKAC